MPPIMNNSDDEAVCNYGEGDSNDPMQSRLPVHDNIDNIDNDSKQGWWYFWNYRRGRRRWSRFNTTAAAFCLSIAALMIGLVLLSLSLQAGRQREANEVAAAASKGSILPLRTAEERAALQQEFWALYNLVRMRDVDDADCDMQDDPYDHFVLSDSPQWRAVQWLLSEDPAQLLSIKPTAPEPVSVARLKQRYALAVLYFHFGGPAWTLPAGAGWLADAANVMDECDWLAVVCNKEGSNNNNGNENGEQEQQKQAAEGGLVTALEIGPQITMRMAGALPSELGLLTALTALDLFDKELQGTIPTAVYQSLVQLQYLDIGRNKLVSLSPDIVLWSQLQTLILASNDLYGALPTELFTLTNLKVLLLQSNPYASGRLFESIASWPAMELLDISVTNISGTLSPEVGTLVYLQRLGTSFSSLTGSIPDEIGACTALTQMTIGDLTGPGSGLTGTIPKTMGLLTNLVGLAFAQAGLSGTLPTELGALTKLQFLDLQGVAALTGTIPSELGLLTDLVIFQVPGTALTGTIPTELGQAINLEGLKLHKTDLTGSIPDQLCALSMAGTLKEISAPCASDNSTGIPEPAQVECACACLCLLEK